VTESDSELAKLYGIANAADAISFNTTYPFTLSALGKSLGFKGWHDVNKLLERLKQSYGFDLKASDNVYHCAVMNGEVVASHRYSNNARLLLEK